MARVLIVEDSALQVMILQSLPSLDGHEVVVAEDLAQARACGDGFDLVLLDANLPDGGIEDGLAAVQGAAPNTVILTARPDAVPEGSGQVLDKTGGPDALDAALAELLQ